MTQLRLTRESGTEGHDPVHGAGVGPSADDQRLALLISGRPAVDIHEGGDHGIVCREIDRRLVPAFDDPQVKGGDHRGDPAVDLLIVGGDRITDIDGQPDRARIQIDHTYVPDQRPGLFVLHGAADPLSVQVKTDVIVVETDEFGHIIAGEIQVAQDIHQDRDRVQALLRLGPVSALSGGSDLQTLADALEIDLPAGGLTEGGDHIFDIIIAAAVVPVDNCPGAVGDRVGRGSALDGAQLQSLVLGLAELAGDIKDQQAFFSVNDREVRVRREAAVGRVRDEGKVMTHAFPLGLFIQAQDHADGLIRNEAAVFEGLHCIEGRDHGPLVVHSAPAADTSVDDLTAVGIKVPAVSFGDDIQMAYDAENARALALIIKMAAEVIGVECPETGLLGHPEHVLVDLLDGSAKGVGTLRSHSHTWDRYESGQRGNHLCPVFFDPFCDLFEVNSHVTEQPLRL